MKNLPQSIKDLIKRDKTLKDTSMIPHIGHGICDEKFSYDVRKLEKSAYIYRNKIYTFLDSSNKNDKFYNLGGGDPIDFKPFPPALKAIKQTIKCHEMHGYPLSQGDKEYKYNIVEYIKSIKINNNDNLNTDNIIFTQSTTHAFSLIMKSILRPYDVVLFTSPCYGLFAYTPERIGGISKFLKLSESDNWLPNPKKLKNRIKRLNSELSKKYSKLDYVPKVAAFVNINPHNPLGTVLSEKHKNLIYKIGKICKDNGAFLIDDLVYYDISYDKDKPPLPVASFNNLFDNTISMLGLSKSYGLAGLRAGIIVANDALIRSIRNNIFHDMDSISIVQAAALSASFCTTKYRAKEYDKYFKKVIAKYKHKFNIVKAFTCGIKSLDLHEQKKILKQIKSQNIPLDLLDNTCQLKLSITPESGFFALVNFNSLKNKKYKDYVIRSAEDLLCFVFKESRLKFLTGKSFSWPNDSDIIGRITYSYSDEKLISRLAKLINTIKLLK